VVLLHEGWKEFFHEQVVGDGVDVEGEADVFFGGVENGFAAGNTSVKDDDGWVAYGGADFFGCSGDGGR
jgi:hypothetical protein